MRARWFLLPLCALLLAACQPGGDGSVSSGYARQVPAQAPASATSAPPPAPELKHIPRNPNVTGIYPASCHVVPTNRPDPNCTPGVTNEEVTQDTIGKTICVPNWTRFMRAPDSQTGKVKTVSMKAYGEDPAARGTTELDHLVSLELGGSNDTGNLWPEPSDIPGAGFRNTKDTVEGSLHSAVCKHQVTLLDAQRAIASNWTTALVKLHVTPVKAAVSDGN